MEVIVTLLMLCVSMTQSVYGCSCMWGTHNQQHFCRADFAIKAEMKNVTSEKTEYGYVLYNYFTMSIFQVYKQHPNITMTAGQEVVVKTGGDGAMCGVYLQKNITYFIAGHVYDDELKMNSCGWIDRFDSLTKSQVRGIEHDYNENCECTRHILNGMYIMYITPGARGSGSCDYGPGQPFDRNCYYNNAYCERRGPNKCRWAVDTTAKPCQKRRKIPKLVHMRHKDD